MEHSCVVLIPAVGQVSHHDSGAVIFLVCPQEGHAGVLALVKVTGLGEENKYQTIWIEYLDESKFW